MSNLPPFEKLLNSKKKVQILNIKVIYNQMNIQYIYYMSAKHNCYALRIRISSIDPQLKACVQTLLSLLFSTVTLKLLNKP